MSQSHSQILLHLVWSTKHRHPFLSDPGIRDELHRFLGGTCGQLDSPSTLVGGVEDHVHILCGLGRSIAVKDLVKELKRQSSIWLKTKAASLAEFSWQKGYRVFSVSASARESVRRYIAEQEEHHRERTFQDEYRLLLRKHGLTWDERYVWD